MSDFLTKEDILNCDDLDIEEVEAWGGKVLVTSLTAAERDEFETVLYSDGEVIQDLTGVRAKLISLTVINNREEKKRIFAACDIKALEKKSAREVNKVFVVAQRLSGLRKEDVEEIAKNSDAQEN